MVDAGFEVLWGQTLAAEPANLSAEVQCTFTAIAEPNARHAYPRTALRELGTTRGWRPTSRLCAVRAFVGRRCDRQKVFGKGCRRKHGSKWNKTITHIKILQRGFVQLSF